MKEKNPDGLVTTTYFHQDDAKRGQAHTTVVGTETFTETEAFTSTNWITDTGVTVSLGRLMGDRAGRIDNPNATWSGINRNIAEVSDGETVSVQFAFTDTATAQLGLLDSTGTYSFGVRIDGSAFMTIEDTDGSFSETTVSGMEVISKTWYVLHLKVDDDDGFLIELWQRDEPATRTEVSVTAASGRNWLFFAQANDSVLWVDEYSEGVVYADSRTDFEVDERSRILLDWEDTNDKEFYDLQGY